MVTLRTLTWERAPTTWALAVSVILVAVRATAMRTNGSQERTVAAKKEAGQTGEANGQEGCGCRQPASPITQHGQMNWGGGGGGFLTRKVLVDRVLKREFELVDLCLLPPQLGFEVSDLHVKPNLGGVASRRRNLRHLLAEPAWKWCLLFGIFIG